MTEASHAAAGIAKSSGPERPRLRQRMSISPSTLPPIRKLVWSEYATGERSREGVTSDGVSSEEDDAHEAS
ncbi:hypothetical protein MA16_Dca011108 [Dendrobium catenatum]|uniref:Uncharacterized protein n=1 Tax=Dendrobium catenatum TaxID=906689 RepID=A0A2I0WSD3_9ASPA|nr:hypothetical protein MA16_Dca011108 [Dendrobium catenatum]